MKVKRVDYNKEVEKEKEYQRKRKVSEVMFKARMKTSDFYYSLNVQTLAAKLGNFLKLYHESL